MVEQPPDFFTSDDINCRQLGIDAIRIMNPEDRDTAGEDAARMVCSDCIYIEPCREWGMTHNQVGVLGGMTERERTNLKHKIRRERSKVRRCAGTEPPYDGV